jgi:hypothetical protein
MNFVYDVRIEGIGSSRGKYSQFMSTTSSEPNLPEAPVSKGRLWTGFILSILPALFLLLDGVMKLMKPEIVVKTTVEMGYQESIIVPVGIVLLICTVLYLIPQTSVLGAILITGYLGGAVATNARIGSPLFSHILFPVYIGVLVWGGLFLRDRRVSALIPFRR